MQIMDYQQGKQPLGVGVGRGAECPEAQRQPSETSGRAAPGSGTWAPSDPLMPPRYGLQGKKSSVNWFLLPNLREEEDE